ncbi:MAG: nucleic acid-binding protein, partial [Spirochaetaceae bacterium]|nr:nucleic acid-binding protein [Spirochaetaceae bacterium]
SGKTEIASTIDSLKAKLEELKKQEEEIIPDLDPEIVFKFERIIRSKQNRGIVAVKGNVCDGCHMILPAQFANIVRNGDDIVFCPYCSRILFYQEQDDTENEFFNIEDAGSLVDSLNEDLYDESEEYDDEDDRDEVKEMDFDILN